MVTLKQIRNFLAVSETLHFARAAEKLGIAPAVLSKEILKMEKYKKEAFLQIAESLNKEFDIVPLLYGSLGLEQRLGVNLDADDVDVLIPEEYLTDNWDCITKIMGEKGYTLYDVHEHAFEKDGLSVAFASIENLVPKGAVEIIKNIKK